MDVDHQQEDLPRVSVRFFAPPDDLASCFTTFYKLDVDAPKGRPLFDYLQPEWANLRFFKGTPPRAHPSDGGAPVVSSFQATGPSSRPIKFELPSTSMWGIGLLPLGWARFVDVPADEYADVICEGCEVDAFVPFIPLHDMLTAHTGSDEEQFAAIVEFFRNLAPPPRDASRILRVHETMIDPYLIEVSKLAEAVGTTTRTLERLCRRHFGFPPRLLLRRQRMMRSLAAFMLADGKSWSETIDRHYHDQAHFVHEFHSFMGMSPTQYAALPHPVLDAFMAERQRVWGSPVQTLDTPGHHKPETGAG